MLKVKVNDSQEFDVKQEKDDWSINGEFFDGDVAQLSPHHYHVIWQDRSFNVEVVEHDALTKKTTLKINGKILTTSAKDRFDLLLESMGMSQAVSNKINEIKAPMPGLIQSIAVQEGDTVKKGDTLLVLVAMKMENAIKAPAEATVKSIRTEAGRSVEKNQVLIEFV
ncbi:biotin/lipoyl-containing protein [Persicitalea sp.]|uniref:biotin/lipoyl-containing protein n=1 Tax=Persicitalea sp. TaxID=3100273 RepID=UPI0035933DA5